MIYTLIKNTGVAPTDAQTYRTLTAMIPALTALLRDDTIGVITIQRSTAVEADPQAPPPSNGA